MKFQRLRHCALLAIVFLITSISVSAQEPWTSRYTGEWKGEGVAFGQPSRPEMKWELALDRKFLKITYRLAMRPAQGPERVFEGHGYYKSTNEGPLRGTWFDSNGAVHPLKAVFENDTLTTNWGTPETEEGRTIYRLISPGKMELIDSVKGKDGSWREFHRATLQRQ